MEPDPAYLEDPDYELVDASSVDQSVDFDPRAPAGSQENPIVILMDD